MTGWTKIGVFRQGACVGGMVLSGRRAFAGDPFAGSPVGYVIDGVTDPREPMSARASDEVSGLLDRTQTECTAPVRTG